MRPGATGPWWKATLDPLLHALWHHVARHALAVDRRAVEVRPLQEADLPNLGGLGSHVAPFLKQALRQQASGQETVLVAWKGSHPVGLGHVYWPGPRRSKAAQAFPGCPEIFQLMVRPLHRSCGIGAQLIAAFEDLARQRGRRQIGLGVHDANPRAAALYFRLGYASSALSSFMDEFDTLDAAGRLRHEREPSRFLVKAL